MAAPTWTPPPLSERIVAAACRNAKYEIVVSARHWDALMHAQAWHWSDDDRHMAEQGFIDQYGQFHTREQAWVIAERNGQIVHVVSAPGKLYSENLY